MHAPAMRQALLNAAKLPALIPPIITTPKKLFLTRNKQTHYLSEAHCQLLLSAALNDNRDLFPGAVCWKISDALLSLFEEINQQESITNKEQALTDEAALLGNIYARWHREISDIPTEHNLYQQALEHNLMTQDNEEVFLCGFDLLTPSEEDWAQRLQEAGKLIRIEYAPPLFAEKEDTAAPPFARALNFAWGQETQSLNEIVNHCRITLPQSPLEERVRIFKPDNLELHATGIQVQITNWLNEGIQDIAVVTQDRKLARRLRALLERKGINVYDYVGWALSTTSSAAALFLLIPPAETGFPPRTLLNLIRSPYCRYNYTLETLQKCVGEIHRLMNSTSKVLETFTELQRFILSHQKTSRQLRTITAHINDTLQPLQALCRQTQQQPLSNFFITLNHTTQALGMHTSLLQDVAGKKLSQEIDAMHDIADQETIMGDWQLWRSWLMHRLEKQDFTPPNPGSGIRLYNFNQSPLVASEALIIAALDKRHVQPTAGIALNDFSREQLGIKTRKFYSELITLRFQRLIQRARKVLLTCQVSENGQTLIPAPWPEELQNFHQLTYGRTLEVNFSADTLYNETAALISKPSIMQQPQPNAPRNLWPSKISASAYKSAVACPYQFFARYCLAIRESTEPATYDARTVYGRHLHTCIAALHQKNPQLPGPMDKPWDEKHLNYAKKLVAEIVTAHFSDAAAKHYAAMWDMRQAQAALERYVEWLVEKKFIRETFRMEQEIEQAINEKFTIYGRLDCMVEDTQGQKHILDYKSGKLPSKNKIASGEDVQIGLYALLSDDIESVSYCEIANTQIKVSNYKDENLQTLRKQHMERLLNWFDDYHSEAPLPAWATDKVCRYCNYSGICRRSMWNNLSNVNT